MRQLEERGGNFQKRKSQTNLRLVGGNDATLVDDSLVLLDIAPVVGEDGLRGSDRQHGAKQNRDGLRHFVV